MTHFKTALAAAAIAELYGAAALAGTVSPISYDMPNGYTGTYNYWDDSYTGAGDTQADGAALTGGLGDLTDGVIATENWNVVEGPRGPNGPYVGWTVDPTITFNFDAVHDFTAITLHVDDSNGTGGVSPPLEVLVNGASTPVIDPAGSAPFPIRIEFLPLELQSNTVTVQLIRRNAWVFLSEVEFEADTGPGEVPLPAGGMLLLSGLGGLALARRALG